jgi:hypothetical protein
VISDRVLRPLAARLFIVAAIAVYYLAFAWTYERFVYPLQNSWGFGLNDIPVPYQCLNWVMVLSPALWMPLRFERPSLLLFLLQYLLVFIPATLVLYDSALPQLEPSQVCVLLVTLFTGLTIWQATYALPLLDVKRRAFSAPLFWSIFALFAAGSLVLNIVVLGTNFKLVDFNKIYDVRFSASDIVSSSGVGGLVLHAQMWLAGFFMPLLFAAGAMYRKRWTYFIVGAVYVFLFGVAGAKSALLGLPILVLIGMWVRTHPEQASLRFVLGMTVLLLVPFAFVGDGVLTQFFLTWYVELVHARIFAIQALNLGQYYNFFYDHPYTFWSHITGISSFITNPYTLDIPRTVGAYFYTMNIGENSGMWASDGIAALGLPGVLVISLIAALLMWLFDSVAARHDVRFVTLALGFIGISFTNISIATTLVSGGALILAIALYCMPPVRSAVLRPLARGAPG